MTDKTENIAKYLVWVDCEMTGLDIENDELIEIAVVVTDFNLNYIESNNTQYPNGISIIIKPTENGYQRLMDNKYVKKMHQKSGLIDDLKNPNGDAVSLDKAQDLLKTYLSQFKTKSNEVMLLSGNSVYTDRKFISKYLSEVDAFFHYRLIDVSTIKELVKSWYQNEFKDYKDKDSLHRAYDDIIESIEELRTYRKQFFK